MFRVFHTKNTYELLFCNKPKTQIPHYEFFKKNRTITLQYSCYFTTSQNYPIMKKILFIPFFVHNLLLFSQGFLADFNENPNQPKSLYGMENWAVYIHSRNQQYELDSTIAHHGPNCEPPVQSSNLPTHDTTHLITNFIDACYLCKNHLMTAIRADGYGLINLVPNQFVDISQGEAIISVDMSTWDSSVGGRDWWSISIMPPADFNPLTAFDFAADLEGHAPNMIRIETEHPGGGRLFSVSIIDEDFRVHRLPTNDWRTLEEMITPSKTLRSTFELRLSKQHLKFGMKLPDGHTSGQSYIWWVDSTMDEEGNPIQLNWDQALVAFGHYSYNPRKNGGLENTWHWDNFRIEPAVPFQLLRCNNRYANAERPTLTLERPAGKNTKIIFGVPDYGRASEQLQVSFDNGLSWQKPNRIIASVYDPQKDFGVSHAPYEMNIPEGSQLITFRGQNSTWQEWMARDVYAFQFMEPTTTTSHFSVAANSDISWYWSSPNTLTVKGIHSSSTANLYDMVGHKIPTLQQEHIDDRIVITTPQALPNGIYLLLLRSPQSQNTIKIFNGH